jgi:hypothetical protein
MHVFVPTRRRLGKAAIRAASVVACATGLMVCAGLNEAEAAQRGGGNRATSGEPKLQQASSSATTALQLQTPRPAE